MEHGPFSLEGKVILVTGASSGIGRQCCITLAQMGVTVILIGRNRERLEETRKMMCDEDKHIYWSADLAEIASLSQLAKDINDNVGPIDGLVNCAGVSTTLPLRFVELEKVDDFLRINVMSGYFLVKEFSRAGMFNHGASFIFMSSIMGIVGEVGKSLYGLTKGAIISMVKSLACELAAKKIRVNCISPGVVVTPINENLPHIANADKRAVLEKKHLLGLGKTEYIANTCVFLLSDASCWITGQNIIVDGGYTIQ